ncbi:CG14229 [Drosophila busckii]|uniref:CG14229 n=1 Tax=Drosophila busckii TaxID=30019 RepID=A0A0M3QXQ4_DROBS|nr:ras guanine nucleotide exchange factor L [Drosophila busckii]ALC46333.1 CG14229 [Drosophila busckii]
MEEFMRTRKRSREDDIPCDSTPLSKRINNLHLNYDDGNSNSSCSNPGIINDNNNYLPTTPAGSGGDGSSDGTNYEYNPELNADQNPYYYEKNKILYDLHAERVKRINL